MKVSYSTLLLILVTLFCNAQGSGLAIINSADGYVNVREEAGVNSKVITRLFNDEVFFCDVFDAEDTDKWVDMVYEPEVGSMTKKQREYYASFINWDSAQSTYKCYIEGLVSRNQIVLLSELTGLGTGVSDTSDTTAIEIKNDTIDLAVKESYFDQTKHKVTLSPVFGSEIIDGKKPYGTLDDIPKVQLTSMQFTFEGRQVIIPDSAFNDMFDFRSHLYSFYVIFGYNKTIYLTMQACDGAGAYDVAWIIKAGKYIGRYIDMTLD